MYRCDMSPFLCAKRMQGILFGLLEYKNLFYLKNS